jgi:hypothetical protein
LPFATSRHFRSPPRASRSPAALGYAAWTYALGHFGAAQAANFLYLVPPVATGLAFVIAGEVPGVPTLAGEPPRSWGWSSSIHAGVKGKAEEIHEYN